MFTIKTRRTIRKYSNREVSDELLKSLIEEAERTQTMENLQLYSVVATRSEEGKKKLAPLHFNQPMITQAPVVLTFVADHSRMSKWCEYRDAAPGYGNFLGFMNAATDALLYCQTFCNLAESRGLGLCYIGTTIYNPKGIIEALSLPRLTMPIATITLGWPDEEPQQPDRLPLEAVFHDEQYHEASRADIDRYYAEKEARPENREFVRINAKENLAQVFTQCRYTENDAKAISASLTEALKQQGFIE